MYVCTYVYHLTDIWTYVQIMYIIISLQKSWRDLFCHKLTDKNVCTYVIDIKSNYMNQSQSLLMMTKYVIWHNNLFSANKTILNFEVYHIEFF